MQAHPLPRATVQQVLLRHPSHASSNLHVQKVIGRLMTCRTAALGYHVYRCTDEDCGHVKYQYHSCRDRHCPQCGAVKKQEWIEARTAELLPVKYYHVVFTLPHELNSLVMGHRSVFINCFLTLHHRHCSLLPEMRNTWAHCLASSACCIPGDNS